MFLVFTEYKEYRYLKIQTVRMEKSLYFFALFWWFHFWDIYIRINDNEAVQKRQSMIQDTE